MAFPKVSEEHDAEDDPKDMTALEKQSHVDEHAHTYQKVRDEERIARKLQSVHQRRHVRDIPI